MKGKSSRIVMAAGLAVLAAAGASRAHAALTENFDDGAGADRWNVAVQTEATADPTTVPDGSVNFGFDYSTLGIAPPAGTSSTIGAFVQVNSTDQAGDEGETYVIFPKTFTLPSGYWRVDADMFVYNDGGASGAGTTELGMVGAYLNPADPVAPYQWGSRGGPLAWVYSGEGGSTADLARFREGTATTTGYGAISDYNAVPTGTIPGFETGAAGSGGPAPDASPNGSWVDVTIEHVDGQVTWYLNGAPIETYDNTGGFYTDGTFFLGTTDPFNSVNPGGGTIIDNIVVTVPEPTSLTLLGLAALPLFKRDRRMR
jgi:hypothetical protein